MGDIVNELEHARGDWARKTLKAILSMSPTSLKIALRQIRLGAKLSFAEVMTMEYRLSQACVRSHDFYEGARAALIEKDRRPKWKPERLSDLPDSAVEKYLEPLGVRDLLF